MIYIFILFQMSYHFYLDLDTVNILLFNALVFLSYFIFFFTASLDLVESLPQKMNLILWGPFAIAVHEGFVLM